MAIACLCTVGASAQKVTCTKTESGEVTVVAEDFGGNMPLTLTVYSEMQQGGETKKYIKQLDEKTTDSSGRAEFKFSFFDTDPSTTYFVSLQDESMLEEAKVEKLEFKNLSAINAVNGAADADALLTELKNKSTSLNIDSGMLNEENEKRIANALFAKKGNYTADNFDKFQSLYFEVCVLDLVNNAKAEELEAIFAAYSCGADVSEGSDYAKLGDAKSALMSRMANITFTSLSEIGSAWKEQTALAIIEKIKYPALSAWISDGASVGFSENYEKLLGFDSAAYYSSLVDKKAPYQAIAGASYATKTEALQAFAAACTTQYNNEHQSDAGGGSYSGRGGGSGGGLPAVSMNANSTPSAGEASDSASFDDLSAYSWAAEAVNALCDKKVLSGTGDGKFTPERAVTREEFLKMLICALDLPILESDRKFSDVPEDAWYREYVETGVSVGIVNGVDEENFGSGRSITRADMAVMTERAAKLAGVELKAVKEKMNFSDEADIPEYAKTSVEKVQMAGIINGYEDMTFRPKRTATRAESAVVIYKLINL